MDGQLHSLSRQSKSKANSWAELGVFFGNYCQSMSGYALDNPNPERVVELNPMLVLNNTTDLSEEEGRLVPLGGGRYEVRVRVAEHNKKYEQYRRRLTIAHELGHYCIETHKSQIFDILGIERWRSYQHREYICHFFAAIFLMPPEELRREVKVLLEGNPENAIKLLCERFQVTIWPLILQMARYAIVANSDWLICLFQFRINPSKPESGRKWRLVPGCICLPRGLHFPSEGVFKDSHIYIDPPLTYAGLDTMRLCIPHWAYEPNWKWIYGQVERLREMRPEEFNKCMPWSDLNKPDNIRSKKQYIHLHPIRLNKGTIRSQELLPGCLFKDTTENVSALFSGSVNVTDEYWQIMAGNLRVQGRALHKGGGLLLVTAQLSIRPRGVIESAAS